MQPIREYILILSGFLLIIVRNKNAIILFSMPSSHLTCLTFKQRVSVEKNPLVWAITAVMI
jgi:hypothetical protein